MRRRLQTLRLLKRQCPKRHTHIVGLAPACLKRLIHSPQNIMLYALDLPHSCCPCCLGSFCTCLAPFCHAPLILATRTVGNHSRPLVSFGFLPLILFLPSFLPPKLLPVTFGSYCSMYCTPWHGFSHGRYTIQYAHYVLFHFPCAFEIVFTSIVVSLNIDHVLPLHNYHVLVPACPSLRHQCDDCCPRQPVCPDVCHVPPLLSGIYASPA